MHTNQLICLLQIDGYEAGVQITRQPLRIKPETSPINGYEAGVQSQMHINHWNCVLQID